MNIYMCDASALLNQPNFIFNMEGIFILHTLTLEELDNNANLTNSKGKNARTIINNLFELWKRKERNKKFENNKQKYLYLKTKNGIIIFDNRTPKDALLSFGYDPKKHDNMLISIYKEIKEEYKNSCKKEKIEEMEMFFVTGDKGMIVKMMDLPIKFFPYTKEARTTNYDFKDFENKNSNNKYHRVKRDNRKKVIHKN